MPNRILKESICTSDTINELSDFQENFFYRLIVNCDDFGRLDARPAILKAKLYPLRERLAYKDIDGALRALAAVGCVEIYEVDGKPYLRLPSWEVHQSVRAKKSRYPAPADGSRILESICEHMNADESKSPRNPIQSESNPNPYPNTNTNPKRAPASPAADAYMKMINSTPSAGSMQELLAFERELGSDVCLRAIDEALDNNVRTWKYVRAILSRWKQDGVKDVQDLERREADRQSRRKSGGRAEDSPPDYYDTGDTDRLWEEMKGNGQL